MGDVVVGVDASDTARRAAEVAAELAAQTGRNLHLVRAIPRQAAEVVEVGREQFAIDADQAARPPDGVLRRKASGSRPPGKRLYRHCQNHTTWKACNSSTPCSGG